MGSLVLQEWLGGHKNNKDTEDPGQVLRESYCLAWLKDVVEKQEVDKQESNDEYAA